MLCRSLVVLLSYCLAIVLSVLLRFTDSDYLPLVTSNSSFVYIHLHENICRFAEENSSEEDSSDEEATKERMLESMALDYRRDGRVRLNEKMMAIVTIIKCLC